MEISCKENEFRQPAIIWIDVAVRVQGVHHGKPLRLEVKPPLDHDAVNGICDQIHAPVHMVHVFNDAMHGRKLYIACLLVEFRERA